VSVLLLLPGTILLIVAGIMGLKAAHRRINTRRVIVIVLVAVAISCVIWFVLNKVSQPPSPDDEFRDEAPP
jgi:membrane protein DedA with SNARE-associated domain